MSGNYLAIGSIYYKKTRKVLNRVIPVTFSKAKIINFLVDEYCETYSVENGDKNLIDVELIVVKNGDDGSPEVVNL